MDKLSEFELNYSTYLVFNIIRVGPDIIISETVMSLPEAVLQPH